MADEALQRYLQRHGVTPEPPELPDSARSAIARYSARHGVNGLRLGEADDGPGFLERSALGAGRALHTVNRFVKPIFLPQEILFSTIAGARDPDTTIFGRLKEVDWAQFVPGVREAPEVTSGSELLSLFGVQNEHVLKWGGIGLELFADPLLAGATIRWAGKGLKSAELIAFGDKLDELSSIGGLYRNSGPVKGWVDKRVNSVLTAIRDDTGRYLGIPSEWFTTAADRVLSRTTAARLKIAGINEAERLRVGDPGREVVVARELGTQRAKDVFDKAYDRLVDANNTLFGGENKGWLRRVFGAIQRGAEAESEFMQLDQKMRDSLLKMGYSFVDENGFLFTAGRMDEAGEVTRRLINPDEISAATSRFEQLQDQVRRIGRKEGLSEGAAESLVSRFSKFVEKVTIADAELGYHLSGYEFVQKKFMDQAVKALGENADIGLAYEAWIEFMRRAVREDVTDATRLDFDDIVRTVQFRGKTPPGMRADVKVGEVNTATGEFRPSREIGAPGMADRFRFTDPELPGPTTGRGRSVKQILEGEDLFSSLNITSYIKGLRNGHMRRAYGMFIDANNFNRYIRSIREGKIIFNNILKDVDIEDALGEGFSAEAKAVRDYISAVSGASPGDIVQGATEGLKRSGTPRGYVINRKHLQQSVVDDLIKQGVSAKDAARRSRDAMMRLVGTMQPDLMARGGIVDRLKDVAANYEKGQMHRPGTFGRKFFDARDEIDQETLEVLGEFMNPLVSLQETISAARVRIPAQEFMRRAFALANEHGLVSTDKNARWNIDPTGEIRDAVRFTPIAPGTETVYGAFSGKYIHPGLKSEIERVITNRGDKALALQRMRALISGGYLAAPNVVATNAIGGIVTAALIGVTPHRLLKAMFETAKPLLRDGGKEYGVYRDLTEHIGVQETSLATQNIADEFASMRLHEMAVGPEGVKRAMDKLTSWFEDRLRKPLGERTWWAGLDGFQFVEKWLKTSVFKTERERLIRQYGDDATGFARATKEAAEMARIAVFDYSELPDYLRWARDYGILMFPGFTYFMIGRSANAVLNRPGAFALADRISEAVTSANLDPEEKMLFYHSMPDWLKQDQGTVVNTYTAKDGSKRAVAIPMNQIIPTNTQFGSNFAESLGTVGIWKPFAEIATAFTFADGEAVFSRHFGGQVFSPAAQGIEKWGQAFGYLYNSLAPSSIRKLIRPGDGGAEGLIPKGAEWVAQMATPIDTKLGEAVHSFNELRTNTPDRRLEEEVMSTILRSTQTIGLGGAINGVKKQLDRERIRLQQALGALNRDFQRAVVEGDQEKAARLRVEILARRQEFTEKWQPLIQAYQDLQAKNQR